MSAKIKKGDDVIVLSGKDKGKTGKILKIIKFCIQLYTFWLNYYFFIS